MLSSFFSRSFKLGRRKALESGVVCSPYQTAVFPYAAYFPVENDTTERDAYYYDDPSLDGVSLNLNLGGWAPSWENDGSEPLGQEVYTYLYNPSWARVDGAVVFNYAGDAPSIRNDYTESFIINNNAAAYNAIGGASNGTNNPTPGHHVYPGVASFNSWSSFVQAKNYGKPIIFELWYSLNNNRVNRSKGFSNYTFFGPGSYSLPWIRLGYYSEYGTTRKVKKYQGGILKADADMNNLQESDFICGVSYVDDDGVATAKLIKKGVVIQSGTSGSNNKVYSYVHCGYTDDLSFFENGKSWIQTLEISYGTNYLSYSGWNDPWTEEAPYDLEAFLDTHLVKWAWIIDCETNGDPYADAIWGDPGAIAMFTPPNFDLPCDPGITLPGYIPPPPVRQAINRQRPQINNYNSPIRCQWLSKHI